ncbi:MAG: sialidase family protein [Planctomycetaceae bacterium]|nr:sialidase family protein [Planctomycetaceae bacterium]
MRCVCWVAILSAVLMGSSTLAAADAGPVVTREFIYETAPFPSCHASTLAETPKGLVAAWFGGTDEKDPDVGIWFARRMDDGWTKPVELFNGVQYTRPDGSVHRYPCWNPILFQEPGGRLLLFYKVGPDPATWWGMLASSKDGGESWSRSRRLPEGILGPVKNKPIRLEDGYLLCPTSSEHDGWRVHFELLQSREERHEQWLRVGPVDQPKEFSTIQPSILHHKDGSLQAIGRSRNGKLFTTTSKDQGRSWSAMALTNLPNPSAGTDAVTMKDGRHVLIYNHTPKGRSPLNVAVSQDGVTWQAALALETEPGEYSYPAVIQTEDGLLHVSYTWKRKKIRHMVLDPAKFTLKPIVDGVWPTE